MITLNDLKALRDEALVAHRSWKTSIQIADDVAAGNWENVWPDGSAENSEPLVENVYVQALEDKMIAAGSMLPSLFVEPTRGTREDRAEANAQQRRMVMHSYWRRSKLKKQARSFARDWLHAGAMYSMPWANWKTPDGRPTFPGERFPWFSRIDPRTVWPIGHNSRGELTSVMFASQRRVADLESDWGKDHPALVELKGARKQRGQESDLKMLEEIWFMDESTWSVALIDSNLPVNRQGFQYTLGSDTALDRARMEWIISPEKHRLFGCPVTELKRETEQDHIYRGALYDVIPMLRVAQNFMARLLDDLDFSMYAPVVLDNIENPEEYGPGAILRGNGDGTANILRDRPPVNFEAAQTVAQLIERARRQGFEPPQRSGEFGASIASAKGVSAVQGTWNGELAWVQSDLEDLFERSTAITANFDEAWCSPPSNERKRIYDWDDHGRTQSITYNPATLFQGDYRVMVSFGDRTGLDEQNHMVRLATQLQLGGISRRTFMAKSQIVSDPLQEEREIALQELTDLFYKGVLPQTIQAGDLGALHRFVEKIDDDKMSVRAAVLETIREMTNIPPGEGQRRPGPEPVPPGGTVPDSLARGGIPGSAEGQPTPGADLARLFPQGVGPRQLQAAG